MTFPKVLGSVVSFLVTMLVASAASAQLVPDFDRCNAANPGRYRNQRLPAMANAPLAPLGAAVDQAGCDAAYERISVCGPPVVTPGPNANQVTVTCGSNPRPANTRPRVHNRTIIVCREDMGLRDTENGCELQPGLPSGYNYAIARLSVARASGELTERLRVAPHTYQETFGGVAWPNGQPRPQDLMIVRMLGAVATAHEQLAAQVRQNANDIRGLRDDLGRVQGQVGQNTNDIRRLEQRPAPIAATRVGLGLGGFYLHMPGASDTGGFGLSVSVLQHPANWTVGFLGRVNLGLGFQPLVPGSSPLWSLAGSAQVHIGRDVVALNVGLAAATLSRFGSAARGEVTGGTAWWIALAVGPEFNWDHFTVGVDFLFGGGQTVGLVGNTSVNPSSFPAVGGLFRAEYRFF